jgi:hypothetical protein
MKHCCVFSVKDVTTIQNFEGISHSLNIYKEYAGGNFAHEWMINCVIINIVSC